MPREEMKKLQSEKLVKQVKHVYDNVPYYRDLMDKKGVKPQDIQSIDDLCKLPFLTKADLRDAYPYGLLAKPLNEGFEDNGQKKAKKVTIKKKAEASIGRNDPCPCGSGKKYKKCCGAPGGDT